VIYLLGFAKSRAQARQIVNHGHVNVNGKRVNIGSYQLKEGDVVEALIINVDRKSRGLNLSIKAKDQAEQNEAMQKLASESSAASGTTNLGALLKAKLNQQG